MPASWTMGRHPWRGGGRYDGYRTGNRHGNRAGLSLSAAQPTFGSNGGRIAGDPSDFGVIALGGVGVVVEAPSLGDLVVGDMGSTVPAGCDFGRRAILRFPLDSLGSQPPAAATLSLAIVESRRDQFPAPGTIDQTPPFSNPGLGAIHVVHIADQPTPTVLAYATPSTGNDPGVLIPADGEPDTRVTVDATAAVRQAVLEGATFVDFRVQADIETDFDCLNDAFFFWLGNQTDPARQPSIEYTTASDTTPPVLTVPAGITADATSPPALLSATRSLRLTPSIRHQSLSALLCLEQRSQSARRPSTAAPPMPLATLLLRRSSSMSVVRRNSWSGLLRSSRVSARGQVSPTRSPKQGGRSRLATPAAHARSSLRSSARSAHNLTSTCLPRPR